MKRILHAPKFEFMDGRWWRVQETFVYHIGSDTGPRSVVVPIGFVTDLASVPRLLWNIFPPTGPYAPAALVHDMLYRTHQVHVDYRRAPFARVSRAYADRVFLEAMKVLGIDAFTRTTLYLAVRLFGTSSWATPVS